MMRAFIYVGAVLICSSEIVQSRSRSGQLYSSLTHMNDLFTFDRMVADLLPFLPQYHQEISSYKKSYDCLKRDILVLGQGDPNSVYITGHPLHLFSVIKRLVLYYPPLRRAILITTFPEYTCSDRLANCGMWAKLSECQHNPTFMLVNCQHSCGLCGRPELANMMSMVTEMENKIVLPSMNDLRGASLALARLQQVYRLSVPSIAEGKIANVLTCVKLNVYDCIRIANESHFQGEYANAYSWYKYASAQATDPDLRNHIHGMKNWVIMDHDTHFEENSVNFFPKRISENAVQMPFISHYAKLCQGHSFMDQSKSANLKCYVSSRGSPYLILQPVKYERIHNDFELYQFYDVITDLEMDTVKQVATGSLERSRVVSTKDPVEIRVSKTSWLKNGSHPYLETIARRISEITGLHVFEGPNYDMAGEDLQVLSYGIAGHYSYHMDCFWKDYDESEWESYSNLEHYPSGDRLATWMFYLSDVQAGGRTAFPKAGVSVRPVKGSAAFWYSIDRRGYGVPLAEHGGCPVLLGHKWVANKWIRENHNFLRRPCI